MRLGNWAGIVAIGCLAAGSALAQNVISAKSGLVHYVEGEVFLGEQINPKVGEYPEIKEGQHLTTKAGRAEILLTPGVVLRVAENSDVAMISNRLSDTRVEIAGGNAVLEAGEISKDIAVQILLGQTPIEIRKPGVYRFDAGTPARIKVYDGELSVLDKSGAVKLKEGKQMLLTSVPAIEKLPKGDSDTFLRWVSRRSGYLAVANVAAANYMRANSVNWGSGGWYYNPMFGMYTYVPMSGRYRNYWDYAYYSPTTVAPPQPPSVMRPSDGGFGAMAGSARGMQDMSGRSYSGGGSSAAPVYQAPATASAPPAAVSSGDGRGAASGGSRGGSSGGR